MKVTVEIQIDEETGNVAVRVDGKPIQGEPIPLIDEERWGLFENEYMVVAISRIFR